MAINRVHQLKIMNTKEDLRRYVQIFSWVRFTIISRFFCQMRVIESQFTSLLSKHLEANGNIVHIADGDADTMIVNMYTTICR